VHVNATHLMVPSLIDCNLLATERDYDRMVERVKLGRSVGRHPVFAAVIAAERIAEMANVR
jgi:hypothetical protein